MKKWIGILATLAVLPGSAWSEATPEARKWLETMVDIYDRAPLSADFQLTIAPTSGMPMSGTANGKLFLKDRKHQRVEMTMTMGAGGTGQSMEIEMLSVTDGQDTWTEMNMGMGKQVIKFSLEDAEKMTAAGGMGLSMNAMDPVAQIEQLTRAMDVEFVSVKGGEVTLSAKMTEKARAAMGNAPLPADGVMTLVLDEKSGYPIRMTYGGDQPMMKLETTRFDFIAESELPPGAFSYTPPEGVPVVDAKQLMGMMGQQGNQR